jgi:hypothetical protein
LRCAKAQENGHAVLVADDVGVGKSREIAGVHADLHSKLAKGGRVLITTVSEANLYDLERELRIFHGVDEENGQLPFQVVRLRDFKESSERPGQKREYKPIPALDNAVYLVEAHNLTPYTRAILDLNIEAVLADEAHKYKNEDASVGMTWKALHRHWMSLKRPLAYFTATPATTLDELEYLYGVKEWSLDGFNDWVSIKTGHTSADDLEEAKKRALPKDDLADVGSDATEVMPGGAISALAEQLRAAQQRGDIQQAEKIRGEIAREEKRQKGRKWGQNQRRVPHRRLDRRDGTDHARVEDEGEVHLARPVAWRRGIQRAHRGSDQGRIGKLRQGRQVPARRGRGLLQVREPERGGETLLRTSRTPAGGGEALAVRRALGPRHPSRARGAQPRRAAGYLRHQRLPD